MIRIYFTIFAALLSAGANAQASVAADKSKPLQGVAIYESKTSTSDIQNRISSSKEISPEIQKMIQDRMAQMFEKTFILYFDKSESVYEEEQKLDVPGSQAQNSGMRMLSSFTGGGGRHYKNIKTKTFAIEKEMMGKEFLVKDSLPKFEWKMTGESKKIGNYTCYKATAIQAAAKTDFRNFRPKTDPKPADSKVSDDKSDRARITNFLNEGEIPKEIEVTAWYAPEIPVSQGPENYYGLPGLILEVSAGKTTMLCSKIVMNPKDRKEIKAPTKGKIVTQKEFDDIVIKKTDELKQQMQSGGGMNGIKMR